MNKIPKNQKELRRLCKKLKCSSKELKLKFYEIALKKVRIDE